MAESYSSPSLFRPRYIPNLWDAVAFLLVFGTLILFSHGAEQTFVPLSAIERMPLSLDPSHLPEYALRTVLRMVVAIVASLVFTLIYATIAAKSRRAEMVLIPFLDILQSVPVLGFLSFTVVGFMNMFPGKVIGVELASVFAIFTSQAWNMTFSFYQSLKTVPRDLDEASRAFRLSSWQKFWRLEVPFSMPGLIWNTMMSMSGGWFFVVASEAISVGNDTYTLPGIGSYVSLAIAQSNLPAVVWALGAMTVIILLYDQILFRPLVAWSEKFRFEQSPSGNVPHSWLLDVVQRTRIFQIALRPLGLGIRWLASRRFSVPTPQVPTLPKLWNSKAVDGVWLVLIAAGCVYAAWQIVSFVATELHWSDVWLALFYGLLTLIRVAVLVAIASVIWVPIGVWIGLRPKVAERIQPLAQFLAAFPANIAFPFFVVAIVHFDLNPDIWLSPLMILGTQWYILFNVIAGASAYPTDLKEAASSFHVGGWSWWRKVILPGVFPYYVTGALTATGGSWNAAIVAEVASWGKDQLQAHGLGAYIADATSAGDYPRIVLGIAVMSLYVILFNRALWHPMFTFAARRLRFD
ncbi:ABC transporter permease [Segnochrobactrum spirostomi]|uniref:ABC transporter permease subunit n=1 Tax=Segnochrobactrum spirostomi TaxID=2608987 RepID=A0A6A7Y5Y1_9HYPH|nr:ABC transporter permease subunit [Segnochrobactrum spirostomi]MQT13092.1 ABC transporter permease subunit [Segnochrobactrum spirostomi]